MIREFFKGDDWLIDWYELLDMNCYDMIDMIWIVRRMKNENLKE